MQSIVVVGASLAGLRAVEELRSAGFDGRLAVVGDEPHLPYDRPPLSKQVLAGEWNPGKTALTVGGDTGLERLDVDWHLGTRAIGLDTWNRRVPLDNGEVLRYEGLVVATGSRPRSMPRSVTGWRKRDRAKGGDGTLAGIHTLRTLDDCLAIRATLDATPRRVVVVGAGFIGAEVAATCRTRGHEVTLVEMLPVPLERAVGQSVGSLIAEIHSDHGVDVRLGVGVKRFVGADRVEQVRLVDGTTLDADLVVVGVGVQPNTEWLAGSSLTVDDGVLCDAGLEAGPGVVAAGDVARWPSARYGAPVRVEHWENAVTMGQHAARTLLDRSVAGEREPSRKGTSGGGDVSGRAGSLNGGPVAYDPVPWFWSDQYDRKVQLAGLVGDADEMVVVDGSLEERRFAAVYRRADQVVGVVAMNRPRQVVAYRELVARGAPWGEAMARR